MKLNKDIEKILKVKNSLKDKTAIDSVLIDYLNKDGKLEIRNEPEYIEYLNKLLENLDDMWDKSDLLTVFNTFSEEDLDGFLNKIEDKKAFVNAFLIK